MVRRLLLLFLTCLGLVAVSLSGGSIAHSQTIEGPRSPFRPFVETQILSSGPTPVGNAVALDGDLMVIGASAANVDGNSDQGAAYLYRRDATGSWIEVKRLLAGNGASRDYFGSSVAIAGDTIVLGATGADRADVDGRGALYVFDRNQGGANNWGEVGEIDPVSTNVTSGFGSAVALNGETIVVGAPSTTVTSAQGDRIAQGAFYVFERNLSDPGVWDQVKELTASDGESWDRLGTSVALFGTTVLVGARTADVDGSTDQGAAYVFERHKGGSDNWGEVAKLSASDGAEGDWFGWRVALDTDLLVVGAPNADVGDNSVQGAAYVFRRSLREPRAWSEEEKLVASDGDGAHSFGEAVAIDGETIVVAADRADPGGIYQAGAV